MNQGPRCVVLMKKNGGEKSHATVPLSQKSCLILAQVDPSLLQSHVFTDIVHLSLFSSPPVHMYLRLRTVETQLIWSDVASV